MRYRFAHGSGRPLAGCDKTACKVRKSETDSIERTSTWTAAQGQIKDIVNNVVFPVTDMILAVLLFVKIATAYMDYRKHGQFDFTAPAILFACLLFSLTAPTYIWNIL